MLRQNLSSFDNSWYSPGRNGLIRSLWFFVGLPILRSHLLPFSLVRRVLLRAFGAKVGRGIVLKPGIRVKYPWRLEIGDYSWIGEDVWIDNLAEVRIGSQVCISQGVYLCTGNHDWSDPGFGLRVQGIVLSDGSWVGARAMICPGVEVETGGVAAAGSVVAKSIPAFEIHCGNPAEFARRRVFREPDQHNAEFASAARH